MFAECFHRDVEFCGSLSPRQLPQNRLSILKSARPDLSGGNDHFAVSARRCAICCRIQGSECPIWGIGDLAMDAYPFISKSESW
jgi:hypothetical protein